jgi:histidinol-phosphate aminotransferase
MTDPRPSVHPAVRPTIGRATLLQPSARPDSRSPILKLNSNENPYPPSPQAIAALRSITGDSLRRYPDANADEFRDAVSADLNVPPDWILVTNGADALIDHIVRACAEGADRPVVIPTPTYPLYAHLATLQPAETIAIPYTITTGTPAHQPNTYRLPIEAIAAANGAVTFIANPNSPTGHTIPIEQLRSLAAQLTGILVIDEAYVDFQEPGTPSALELVREFEHVIVLRTLSKGYALAGLRLGFGVANPRVWAEIAKVKPVYNVDAIAVRVGAAAIADRAYKDARSAMIRQTRSRFTQALHDRGFAVWPSCGNFVLVRPPDGAARSLHDALRSRQIWTRHYSQPDLADQLRITIGTDSQMQQVIAAIDAINPHATSALGC